MRSGRIKSDSDLAIRFAKVLSIDKKWEGLLVSDEDLAPLALLVESGYKKITVYNNDLVGRVLSRTRFSDRCNSQGKLSSAYQLAELFHLLGVSPR